MVPIAESLLYQVGCSEHIVLDMEATVGTGHSGSLVEGKLREGQGHTFKNTITIAQEKSVKGLDKRSWNGDGRGLRF